MDNRKRDILITSPFAFIGFSYLCFALKKYSDFKEFIRSKRDSNYKLIKLDGNINSLKYKSENKNSKFMALISKIKPLL